MSEFELSPRQVMELRRARVLATKINLLLDVVRTESGEQLEYPAIRNAALKQTDYYLSRTRWSLLKNGKASVVPEEALRALAAVFDVDPQYLLEEGAELPPAVEVALEAVRPIRRAEVRRVAGQALSVVDPEAFQAIAKILDNPHPAATSARPRENGEAAETASS
jgi:hypothetical protein